MSTQPRRPAALRGGVFRGRDAIEAGLLSNVQLRSKAWQRLFQGVYADSSLAITYRQRCEIAVRYVLPSNAVIAGRSAAAIHGAGLERPKDLVEAMVPLGFAIWPHGGCVVHRGTYAAGDCQEIKGLRVTTPLRTCWDLARWLEPVEAVVLIDRLLANGVVTEVDLAEYLESRAAESPRPRGLRRVARVLPLVDGSAESPQESRLRVGLMTRGLPKPKGQYEIRTADGRLIARVDLAWPEFGVVAEYDGAWHADFREQFEHDRKRLNSVQLAGWVVVHVTAKRLRDDLDGIVAELKAAMRRRR